MPLCRTLEEMRALKTPRAADDPPAGFATTTTTTTTVWAGAPVTTTTTVQHHPLPPQSLPPHPPLPQALLQHPPLPRAGCEWNDCEYAPYLCLHHRAPPHWCRVCTHRRLFPDMVVRPLCALPACSVAPPPCAPVCRPTCPAPP